MTNCDSITDDEPFPITGSGDDADWIEPIPPDGKLVDYEKVKEFLTATDADMLGWTLGQFLQPYRKSGQTFIPFNWMEIAPRSDWRGLLEKTWYSRNDVAEFDATTPARYLDYTTALSRLGGDVGVLLDAAGANDADPKLRDDLLAIDPFHAQPSKARIHRCIFLEEQVDRLAAQSGVKDVPVPVAVDDVASEKSPRTRETVINSLVKEAITALPLGPDGFPNPYDVFDWIGNYRFPNDYTVGESFIYRNKTGGLEKATPQSIVEVLRRLKDKAAR